MNASRGFVISFVLTALSLAFVGVATIASAQTPKHIWSQRFGDADSDWNPNVAADVSGNVIVGGYFWGTVDFGGGVLTSAGGQDVFVAKFDAAGNHIWSKRFGDESGQHGGYVAADGSGNVIVSGFFEGTMDFGGGLLVSAGSYDIYVAKFDAAGNHIWSQRFGDATDQRCIGAEVDGSGNVIVGGSFWGTVDFGGGVLTSAGAQDVFVAKFDAAGNHIWSKRFGDESGQHGGYVAADGSGNVIVTADAQGTMNFGGGPLVSADGFDIFVAKFDAAGDHIWSQRFGEENHQYEPEVAVDGSGNVVVTGYFEGTVDFGGGPLVSADPVDIYVAKFDAAGNHIWSQRFGGMLDQRAHDIAVDGSGNVIVTGTFKETVDFGGGRLFSAGSYDIFVAKFDAAGNHIWSQRFGDADFDWAFSVAVDGSGNVVATGTFQGTVDFGGGPLTSAGSDDIYIAKFRPEPSPTLLQSSFTAVTGNGIEIHWRLAEAGEDMRFHILRVEAETTDFRELYNVNILQENMSFTFVDNNPIPGLTYRYRVDVSDVDGRRTLFETEAITVPVLSLSLNQNYPNPFNPTTTISFVLPENAGVSLSVYSVDGRLIKTLVDKVLPSGVNEVTWDGRDTKGNPVSSGVYLYRLNAQKRILTKKLVLLR